MNWLAHGALSPDHLEIRMANLLADAFPKGFSREPGIWSTGLDLHQAIDVFTDRHEVVKRARRRFPAPWHHASGVITDILFDHFLSRRWNDWFPFSLVEFWGNLARQGESLKGELPVQAEELWANMCRHEWLCRYHTWEGLEDVLGRLQKRVHPSRLSRVPLAGSVAIMKEKETDLANDFSEFFPELVVHVEAWLAARALPGVTRKKSHSRE